MMDTNLSNEFLDVSMIGGMYAPKKTESKCSVCLASKKTFYCNKCIQNGNFTHSTKFTERFADKKLKLLKVNNDKEKLIEKYEQINSKKQKAISIRHNIEECKENIKYLKYSQEASQCSKDKKLLEVKEINKNIKRYADHQNKYKGKLAQIATYYSRYQEKQQKKLTDLEAIKQRIRQRTQWLIRKLIADIFPIETLASKGSTKEDCYSIVNNFAILPKSGEYTQLERKFLEQLPICIVGMDDKEVSKCRLAAALTYTTQLVQLIYYILDIRLPRYICFSEFCTGDLQNEEHKIAKLNSTVLYLCESQKVKISNPFSTISNLLACVESSDLGSHEPFEINATLMDRIEEKLCPKENEKDLKMLEERENTDEEDEDVDLNWEMLQPENIPSSDADPSQAQGLMTSTFASIWKVFGGHS